MTPEQDERSDPPVNIFDPDTLPEGAESQNPIASVLDIVLGATSEEIATQEENDRATALESGLQSPPAILPYTIRPNFRQNYSPTGPIPADQNNLFADEDETLKQLDVLGAEIVEIESTVRAQYNDVITGRSLFTPFRESLPAPAIIVREAHPDNRLLDPEYLAKVERYQALRSRLDIVQRRLTWSYEAPVQLDIQTQLVQTTPSFEEFLVWFSRDGDVNYQKDDVEFLRSIYNTQLDPETRTIQTAPDRQTEIAESFGGDPISITRQGILGLTPANFLDTLAEFHQPVLTPGTDFQSLNQELVNAGILTEDRRNDLEDVRTVLTESRDAQVETELRRQDISLKMDSMSPGRFAGILSEYPDVQERINRPLSTYLFAPLDMYIDIFDDPKNGIFVRALNLAHENN